MGLSIIDKPVSINPLRILINQAFRHCEHVFFFHHFILENYEVKPCNYQLCRGIIPQILSPCSAPFQVHWSRNCQGMVPSNSIWRWYPLVIFHIAIENGQWIFPWYKHHDFPSLFVKTFTRWYHLLCFCGLKQPSFEMELPGVNGCNLEGSVCSWSSTMEHLQFRTHHWHHPKISLWYVDKSNQVWISMGLWHLC